VIEATYGDIVPILKPLMDVLEGMADGAESLAGSGVAMADSPAMAEMSKEASIAGDDFEEPVHAAHTNASILRFAATDYVRQFAAMFRGQPVPVYAHLPVARASLEAAALSYWAGARGIGPTMRVQRYQAIRLRNSRELKRSPIPEFKPQGAANMAQIRQQSANRGWAVIANEKRIVVGEQELPGSGALIKALLSNGTDAQGLQHLGATAWWLWSGVSHAANYALLESVDATNAPASPLGPNTVPIFTSSRTVGFQALIVGHGFRTLVEEHRFVFGWSSDAWTHAAQRFVGATKVFLSAFSASSPTV
jgi:hypothetical protein